MYRKNKRMRCKLDGNEPAVELFFLAPPQKHSSTSIASERLKRELYAGCDEQALSSYVRTIELAFKGFCVIEERSIRYKTLRALVLGADLRHITAEFRRASPVSRLSVAQVPTNQ